MKRFITLSSVFMVVLFFFAVSVKAQSQFEIYLNDFYQKQDKASKILKEIEKELKDGSRYKVCARQKEAANYGIEATESLINAFKANGSLSQIENLQAGLEKWRELRDYC